jgi:hypothetical protein
VKAASAGAYGFLLGYKAEPWDADVKFFAMNTHSANPSLRMTLNALTPGVRSVSYAMVYPEDVTLLGLSFIKKLAPSTRLLGEVAYRPHQPVTLNAFDVLSSFVARSPASVLALNKGITTLPVGASFDAYDRFGVTTGSLGLDTVFPKTLGAERISLLAEVGVSQVRGLPDPAVLRYGRPLAYNGAAYTGGGRLCGRRARQDLHPRWLHFLERLGAENARLGPICPGRFGHHLDAFFVVGPGCQWLLIRRCLRRRSNPAAPSFARGGRTALFWRASVPPLQRWPIQPADRP